MELYDDGKLLYLCLRVFGEVGENNVVDGKYGLSVAVKLRGGQGGDDGWIEGVVVGDRDERDG